MGPPCRATTNTSQTDEITGVELAEVATIMGWEPGKVQEIALRYVTSEEFGKAVAARMQRNTGATEV